MKIAVAMNAHDNAELVFDTVESIKHSLTDDILVVVDGFSWDSWGRKAAFGAAKLKGFNHGFIKGPYRNMTLGLMKTAEIWPDADWYLYTEYDVLYAGNEIKAELENADKEGIWCLGFNERQENYKFPLLEAMLKTKFECSRYLLGCCVFHNGKFIRHLKEINFFERFLHLTNDFPRDFFPGFDEQKGYDFGEHLYPTLAHHYGGKVKGLSSWQDRPGIWRGNFRQYPVRFQPPLDDTENFTEALVMHPVKDYHHPIRQQRRVIRKREANGKRV